MRETLFISHATPEDNAFVTWLSSRLQLLGYKVWYDLGGLKGGEKDFWKTIEEQIRNEACKFIFVVSKTAFLKDGVIKEFQFGEAMAKENNIQDFVLPLRLEDVPYTVRIGLNVYNIFDFTQNWEAGLKQILGKLQKDNVPRALASESGDILFNKINLPQQNLVVKKKEIYYSNWWPIESLPDKVYFFHFETAGQAKAILKESQYPTVRHGNYLITFSKEIPTQGKSIDDTLLTNDISLIPLEDILPKETIEIDTAKILNGFESEVFPKHRDAENQLKKLLSRAFHLLMKNRGLNWYELASRQNCYFYHMGLVRGDKVVINYPNRTRKKNLIGKQKDAKWHFGVSTKIQLSPFLCFNLKTHILFSDDGHKIWTDKGKLHSARRKKGRTWFNEHWRDQLLAFLHAIKKEDENGISIALNKDFVLSMPQFTKTFDSEFGYHEPQNNDRQSILNTYDDEEEVKIEIEESTGLMNE